MREIYQTESTEGVLLVDADNAFNRLNRKVAINNIKNLCPAFHRYLDNTYKYPSKLHMKDDQNKIYRHILSKEGSTQGDVAAMAMYALGTRPLLDELKKSINVETCKQVWYADDSSCGGKLEEMRRWWNKLNEEGPKYGYFPKGSKTILIVKANLEEKAKNIFKDTDVTITTEGERHLGAVIGSETFRRQYVSEKISKWKEDVLELTVIAKDEPQLAYAAFTKALCKRWSFVQRTIDDISDQFQSLEEVIRHKLIPSIIGRKVNDIERRLLALPVRLGGLGIENPSKSCGEEFKTSVSITKPLSDIIYRQEENLENYDSSLVKNINVQEKKVKSERLERERDELKAIVDDKLKRTIDILQEKGAGSWLTSTPIQALGYSLNKQEFKDAIHLRYGWRIANTPTHCSCGIKNTMEHVLNCKVGGFVAMRHDSIKNLDAELLREVAKDVKIEPELLPIANTDTIGTKAEKARLDVSAVGLWGPLEKTFIDVRVMHPNSASYMSRTPSQLYAQHEKEKKSKYLERVVQVEKASFTPLIFSTFGGMGNEATKHFKRIAELLSRKRNEEYSDVINYIRTRIRFTILRSTLIAIRGVRGRKKRYEEISDVSFNLVPMPDE